jgi:O-antigen/teichoic acid export membrane protein
MSSAPAGAGRSKDYFDVGHLRADLRGRAVRGGVVTISSQGGRLALQLLSSMVLARLIAPEQFGFFAMATAVTGFVYLFREMGLSTATVQRPDINHGQISVLFWINVAMGVLISLVMFLLAWPVAWFYGVPDLANLVRVLSLGPVVGGLAVQHNALLQRQMRFGTRAAINLTAMFSGVVGAIVLARLGAGYWALAAMSLIEECVSTAGALWACRWRPGLPRRGTRVREMVAFGRNLVGYNVFQYMWRNLDNVLVGRFVGAEALGLYSRAYGLLSMPLNQLNAPMAAVAIPALSRLADAPERYRRAYCSVVEKIQMVSVPGIAYLILCADWVIALLLGPRWHSAAVMYAYLGLAGIVQPLANTTGWLFITQGRTKEMFRWGLINGGLVMASWVVGLPWGAVGVSAAYGISGLLLRTPLLFWYVCRRGPITQADLYGTLKLSGTAAAGVACSIWALRQMPPLADPLVGLAVSIPVAVAVSLVVYAISPRGRRILLETARLVPQAIVNRRQEATSAAATRT